MADEVLTTYINTLSDVLLSRKDWLESEELVKLKENLRNFQTSFSSIYNIYLKKKIINEDPYKQDTKISELEVPDSSPFQDVKKTEQLSIRLSNFDNQLDFLVNFYQLGVDFLNLERVKRIGGLIRYIDWISLTPDSQSLMTAAVAEITLRVKQGLDNLTMSIIGESLNRMSKMTGAVITTLKHLNLYYKESYKLNVRQKITKDMSAQEANLENIKKKFPAAMPGMPFYRELIDEIIREDYSPKGMELRDNVLNSLKVAENKPKAQKVVVDYKKILLDGIQVIGGASTSLVEISAKLEENQSILDSAKKGFFNYLKELIRQITNAEPEEVIHNIEYIDSTTGGKVREKISFHKYMDDLSKKTRILSSFVKGTAYQKLTAMSEDQIIGYLERNINDVQAIHKTLNALDDFFKSSAEPEQREKIKGIKPELSALKNSMVKANQLRYEYSAQKEQEEQLKRLGLAPGTLPVVPPISEIGGQSNSVPVSAAPAPSAT